jgi:putative phosphoribosyl transferase
MDALADVAVPVDGGLLAATLTLPRPARGMVVFAHGSGSSRHSPRNQAVARHLHQAGYGTVLLDLLTEREERLDQATGELRFDIGLLADRLVATLDWLPDQPDVAGLPVGLFGASTGAAAALVAAARRRNVVRAVVSRGGRPDLAANALDSVRAPTLLIVGGEDDRVIELNKQAAAVLGSRARIVIVPGASHLFTEPGALEQVSEYARDWFDGHLEV